VSNDNRIYLNGVDGETGQYLVPPFEPAQAAALARDNPTGEGLSRWLKRVARAVRERYLGLPIDVDARDVAQAGWAIVFHTDEPAPVREALEPLVDLRRTQVGDARTKVLEYRAGEQWRDWLARHGVSAGTIDPTKVPYYVLLVGEPSRIPYSFQFLLDIEYGVGRIAFDTAAEYRAYAESIVEYESGEHVPTSKTAVFFGTRHAFDRATQLSADALVAPLAKLVGDRSGFETRLVAPREATKETLATILRGNEGVPAFCFTATHGVGFRKGHPDQLAKQGALICQDWARFGALDGRHYFAAEDVPSDARLHGLVAFHFACFGVGTPEHDNFMHEPGVAPPQIAERPFVAKLPQALLAHPGGGALAVIGHVERAWGCSIGSAKAGAQLLPFENAAGAILRGWPVGYACKDFNERYAALSAELSELLEQIGALAVIPDDELASVWLERNDARNYAVVGDPAAHIRVDTLLDGSRA
jgi:hypothetical protein